MELIASYMIAVLIICLQQDRCDGVHRAFDASGFPMHISSYNPFVSGSCLFKNNSYGNSIQCIIKSRPSIINSFIHYPRSMQHSPRASPINTYGHLPGKKKFELHFQRLLCSLKIKRWLINCYCCQLSRAHAN